MEVEIGTQLSAKDVKGKTLDALRDTSYEAF